MQDYGRIPLGFKANRGQTDAGVDFLGHGPGFGIFLTPTAAELALEAPGTASAPPGL